jgi:hypothetical protein
MDLLCDLRDVRVYGLGLSRLGGWSHEDIFIDRATENAHRHTHINTYLYI